MLKSPKYQIVKRKQNSVAWANQYFDNNNYTSLQPPPFQLKSKKDKNKVVSTPYRFGHNSESNSVEKDFTPSPLIVDNAKNDNIQELNSEESNGWVPSVPYGELRMPDMEIDQVGREIVSLFIRYSNSEYANSDSSNAEKADNNFSITCDTNDPLTIKENIQQLGMILEQKKREIEDKQWEEELRKREAEEIKAYQEELRRSRLSEYERKMEDEKKEEERKNSEREEKKAKAKARFDLMVKSGMLDKPYGGIPEKGKREICVYGNFCPSLDPIRTKKAPSAGEFILDKIAPDGIPVGPWRLKTGENRKRSKSFLIYDTERGWFPDGTKNLLPGL